MNILKNTKTSFFYAILIFTFSTCVKDSDFTTPIVECNEPLLVATNTLQQVKEMYTFGAPTRIDSDIIIEGYVVSSDKSGNIYKSISIQDKPENPTSAIKISIDKTDLYSKYNVGRKIFIKMKGLSVGYAFGSIQIGKINNGELAGVPALEIQDHLFRSCEVVEIIPKKVKISDLNKDLLEMLIEIENVQFKAADIGKSYAEIDNTSTVNRIMESTDDNCNLLNELLLRNSGYADFKNNLLPEGRGSVIGVLGNYYSDFQLYIRDTDDVKLQETRCDIVNSLVPNITLNEVKNLFEGEMVEFGVDNNYITEGYVVSSDEFGNFHKKLIIQDAFENPTAGVQILVEMDAVFEQFTLGDKVIVSLDKLYMTKNEGVLSLGFPKGNRVTYIENSEISNFIFNSHENYEITPTPVSITETVIEKFQNTLVKVEDVQLIESELQAAFTFFSGSNSAFRTLETCNEPIKLSVFTNGNATFSNDKFPVGHGDITGIIANNLEIRTIEDVNFINDYEVCPVIIPKIMITEIADPANDVSARFVELYNAGDDAIDLSGWKLHKYINGNTAVSGSGEDLSGIILLPGDFAIISNSGFAESFGFFPSIESSYISGNGDDVYELVDNTGETIDIFGLIGEDGNGTNWEYLDGKALRNNNVLTPNKTFTPEEWTIYSKASNQKISNSNMPQNAPENFNPTHRD